MGSSAEQVAAAGEYVVGSHVTILTKFDEEVTGEVFAHDPETGTLVLKQRGTHGGVHDLRLYASAAIKAVVAVAPPEGDVDLSLPHVDAERARQREEKALRQAEADLSKVGVGVTREAQSIFDALSKTLPCAWRGSSILVMDVVTVEPPYTPASCAAKHAGEARALERIRRVLTAERTRLGLAV